MKPKKIEYEVDGNGCHICTSHRCGLHGYPRFNRNGNVVRIKNYLMAKKHGEIPKGIWILHTCDNRLCINIEHLYLGTRTDNIRDAVLRDRLGVKITNADVLRIRELKGKMLAKYLALYYGVHINHIFRIWGRERRRYI